MQRALARKAEHFAVDAELECRIKRTHLRRVHGIPQRSRQVLERPVGINDRSQRDRGDRSGEATARKPRQPRNRRGRERVGRRGRRWCSEDDEQNEREHDACLTVGWETAVRSRRHYRANARGFRGRDAARVAASGAGWRAAARVPEANWSARDSKSRAAHAACVPTSGTNRLTSRISVEVPCRRNATTWRHRRMPPSDHAGTNASSRSCSRVDIGSSRSGRAGC